MLIAFFGWLLHSALSVAHFGWVDHLLHSSLPVGLADHPTLLHWYWLLALADSRNALHCAIVNDFC